MSIKIEKCSLKNESQIIYDITPFTHVDYPDKLSCIVWFTGCNMRCVYCYNPDIVFAKKGKYTFDELFDFLDSRVGLLDAVVLSGGEVLQHDIRTLCKEIKRRGFLVKIDTNGTSPNVLNFLINSRLVDYIALDYKSPPSKFKQITASKQFDLFAKSLDILLQSDIEYEVRTTVHTDFLNENDINEIIDDLYKKGYKKTYYIQNFFETDSTIADVCSPCTTLDISKLSDILKIEYR